MDYAKYANRPKIRNDFGQSPLHFAVRFGDLNITNILLQRQAPVNIMDDFGNTPLSLACIEKPDVNMVKLLIHYGADVNFERMDHQDLLLECVLNSTTKTHIDIIKILIKNGIYINATDKINNRNCMHYVAMTGYLPLAELLLKKGAVLDIRDNFNFTPTELAEIHKNEAVLTLFNAYK